ISGSGLFSTRTRYGPRYVIARMQIHSASVVNQQRGQNRDPQEIVCTTIRAGYQLPPIVPPWTVMLAGMRWFPEVSLLER
ncbi:MAG TPA: hypothetical protein VM099_13215, partial [Gemmatimonadaceae bacterium]|nr:hypothetical protein [Gemmatimonadaceae bacterium]